MHTLELKVNIPEDFLIRIVLSEIQPWPTLLEALKLRAKIHFANVHSFFSCKNLFYKNFEAEIDQNFKNMLRT